MNSSILFGLVVFASMIFVFNTVYVEDALAETISSENKTTIVTGEPTDIKIITYGMFDAEEDGNLVNQLFVGETYWFNIEYQNELKQEHDIRIFMQMMDKNKTVDNVLRKIDGHGFLDPSEMLGEGFEWTPEYSGQFGITTVLTALDDPSVNSTTQYDFIVMDRPPLKHQIKNAIPINNTICKNENHFLVERTNKKLACVYLDTAEKLDWKSINSDVIILSQSVKESLLMNCQDMPEVVAFYAKYNDAQVSVRDDHISYFAGNEDGFLMRMNIFFDKDQTLDHIDLHCYFQKIHQYEVSQEDIISKLEKYDCEKSST